MSISSIDEILMGGGGNSQQPEAPEHVYNDEPEPIGELEEEVTEYANEPDTLSSDDSEDEQTEDKADSGVKEIDEYGNEKEPENEAIRERLARQARKHESEIAQLRAQLSQQGASEQIQQAAKDFEYDPDSSGDWQQQLASFVKQTVKSMGQEEVKNQQLFQEQQIQAEFEGKLSKGIEKFNDFPEVIASLNFEITNPMTLATRGMSDPVAFLYAAAKRNPQELERISKLRDPYAQMTEIGKLEERMRKNKPTTKAPRPLGRSVDDSLSPQAKKKVEQSGDDLLARADAKRLATVKTRLRGNR